VGEESLAAVPLENDVLSGSADADSGAYRETLYEVRSVVLRMLGVVLGPMIGDLAARLRRFIVVLHLPLIEVGWWCVDAEAKLDLSVDIDHAQGV